MMLPPTHILAGHYCWNQTQEERAVSERVVCRGTIWLDNQPLQDASLLQQWLDRQGNQFRHIFRLDGDFLLNYCTPDFSFCLLYRPLTAAHTIYYRLGPNTLSWSTTIETLFDHTPTLEDINSSILAALVCAGEYDPEQTPYHAIRCLRAGQCLVLSSAGNVQMLYDDFQWQDYSALPFEEAASLYRQYCREAVQRAVSGYKHIGIFLSGGLDSAVIAFEARALGCQVEGFHWTWSQLPGFRQEQQAAQILANTLDIPLHIIEGDALISEGGGYLQALSCIPLPYNHSFFASFQQTAQRARQRRLEILLTGHLGDTLFESERLDGIQEKVHQGHLLTAFGDLLSCYSRRQTLHTLWTWLAVRKPLPSKSSAGQRIERCRWLTTSAIEEARATGQYVYQAAHPFHSDSTARLYQSLMANINAETFRDTIRCQHALFPQGIAMKHPYLSRSLLECCLSFGRQHRTLFAAGETISKPLARYAYLGDLPPTLLHHEMRLPYAAVDEHYVLRNREALFDLLGKESCLVRLGILHPDKLNEVFDDVERLMEQADALLPAAGVELWLRQLENRPWQQPVPPAYQKRELWTALPQLVRESGSETLSLAPGVQAYEVHYQLILIHSETGQVVKLDQMTHLFLRLVAFHQTIPQALTALAEIVKEPVDETIWCTVLVQLGKEGWILLPQQIDERIERQMEEEQHV